MIKSFGLLSILILFSFSSMGQTGKKKQSKPPPPPPAEKNNGVEKNPSFGNYYKIAEYAIRVPFNEQPNKSPVAENTICKVTSYQYAYPKPSDDINILYGIDVCEFKSDTVYKNAKLKIDYLAANTKKMYESAAKGSLIKEVTGGADGAYFIRQKMLIKSNELGEIYLTSLYFISRGNVVRLFVFTPNSESNTRIDEFFASVKFD